MKLLTRLCKVIGFAVLALAVCSLIKGTCVYLELFDCNAIPILLYSQEGYPVIESLLFKAWFLASIDFANAHLLVFLLTSVCTQLVIELSNKADQTSAKYLRLPNGI